jgi:hypothetical protein
MVYAQDRFRHAEVSMQNDSAIFVGMDVHKDSITVACVGSSAVDPVIDFGTIGTQQYAMALLHK